MQVFRCFLFCVFSAVTYALVEFRPATVADVSFAQKTMLRQAMNPLFISQQTLLVATMDSKDEKQLVVGFGQIRPLTPDYAELASLYVLPEYRKQGIGTALVEELLKRHDAENHQQKATAVCLLTLRPTIAFYAPHGFKVVQNIPEPLYFEFKVGSVISTLLGNDLVCMVR